MNVAGQYDNILHVELAQQTRDVKRARHKLNAGDFVFSATAKVVDTQCK
jgi:hypothetical protein